MLQEMLAPQGLTSLRQVREDKEFYIPDFMSENPYKLRPKVYSAANDHARDLREAEQHLDDALNLAGVLRAAVQGEDDGRAMQADTVLKIIEKRLSEAHNCTDRHGTRHLNLFMAYFDLKDAEEGPAEG
ncbi:MAG: hypothetical protein ACREQ8_07105 [Woeseiaceae bacterium]